MTMLAALLLEGGYLVREIESIGVGLAVLGLLLASWLAYKSWGRLRQAERRPDGTLKKGLTLERWTEGVLLVLPGVLLVVLPVVNFFESSSGRMSR